jgi:hypothetical protein
MRIWEGDHILRISCIFLCVFCLFFVYFGYLLHILRISARILHISLRILRMFLRILHILRIIAFCIFCILVWVSFCSAAAQEALKFSSCHSVVWVEALLMCSRKLNTQQAGQGRQLAGAAAGGPAARGAAWVQLP